MILEQMVSELKRYGSCPEVLQESSQGVPQVVMPPVGT